MVHVTVGPPSSRTTEIKPSEQASLPIIGLGDAELSVKVGGGVLYDVLWRDGTLFLFLDKHRS